MRIFAAIGLVTGIMLVCAPLVLPRLGIGAGDTRSAQAGLPGKGAGQGGGGMAALWAMLPGGGASDGDKPAVRKPGSTAPLNGTDPELAAAIGPAAGIAAAGLAAFGGGAGPSTDELCGTIALSGKMSAADCAAQIGPGGVGGMMSEVQRAMEAQPGSSGRPGVRPQAKRPGPGAKFVKVGD